ncbi:19370_t:CDS:2 [Gigaspora margarita]|uniref:19370_t:CDS:1 n=1 Tax=Gigaspora margarita TaxID=4874 RepID=A0ABN7WMY5_GIGMA|nr:19370_t:CDS:2 [Gigaspora margarita]
MQIALKEQILKETTTNMHIDHMEPTDLKSFIPSSEKSIQLDIEE